MKATILYLYHDFLNLYGDNGNVRIMEKRLKDQGLAQKIASGKDKGKYRKLI